MEIPETTTITTAQKHDYSLWAMPPEEVASRAKKLIESLGSEFGGPQFEPHVTVVGAIALTEHDALDKFRSACEGLKAYTATVDRVATRTGGGVLVLLHPTSEVMETSEHCSGHFGHKHPNPYMPHLSVFYGELTDDEKKRAEEKVKKLDDSINGLTFKISCLQLWKTDTQDKTLKSWEKIAECSLSSN
ncbi:hypothetical protein K2173_006547 [Erythroxylum novogranatense]|uniref:Cyclic phosphodiesterase n=1 Tax=Erythroxylum novogranatense TaxID=1862640 RepID=A0AAV8T6R4_9ROSI|nr:hypothetical protein K2173_006547 [Erythroxylum novogranatense]